MSTVTRTIFLSPVIFGLAHLHHFYEFRLTNPRVSAVAALLRSLLQFSYTTLFGAYATFLFLRTGSVLAIFVVHAFCNCMGFPRFWGRLQPADDVSAGVDVLEAMRKSVVSGSEALSASCMWVPSMLETKCSVMSFAP